MERDSHEP